MSEQRYLDDFVVGERFLGPERPVTRDDFTRFARLTGDDHPIHHDLEYAVAQGFAGPVAHGLLLSSLTALGSADVSRSMVRSMVALIRHEARYLRPVVVGDVVRAEYAVAAVEPSRADRGVLKLSVRLMGLEDKPFLEGGQEYLLRRRGPASSPPAGG